MNERDFDNIFRRKLEQITPPSPDDALWQNIGNQLDNPSAIPVAATSARWWKASALALLLALLGSNFYLWKKLAVLASNSNEEKNIVEKAVNTTIVQHDTIVRYIYIEEKIKNEPYLSSTITDIKNKVNPENSNTQKESVAEKAKSIETNIINNVSKNVENVNNQTQNQAISEAKNENKSEIINQENIENKDFIVKNEEVINVVNTEENSFNNSTTQLIQKSHIDSSNAQIFELSNTQKNHHIDSSNTSENTNKNENSKIEPVKERKIKQWSVGLNTFGGGIEEKGAEGYFSGIGVNLSINISPKWRITTSIDAGKMDYENRFGKSYTKHQKPNPNPEEEFYSWRVNHQPFVQWNLGVERAFKVKKLETFVGIGTGLTVVLPHEVRYTGKNTTTQATIISKIEENKIYTTLSGLQLSAGVSYPIYKRFSVTSSTHYQRSINDKKVYWENLLSGRIGLKYSF